MRKDDLLGASVGTGRATSLVPDISDQTAGSMTREFIDVWKPISAILAPLPVGAKPIGRIYWDRVLRNQPVISRDY